MKFREESYADPKTSNHLVLLSTEKMLNLPAP